MSDRTRAWGPPATMYVLVIIGATIATLFTTDAHWWIVPLAGFVILPALFVVVAAIMAGLDALWGVEP